MSSYMRKNKRKVPRKLLSTSDVPFGTFAAIDPQSKKLFIPLNAMLDTQALHRSGVPSLCLVFFEGRCRQGANCFQAHADEHVVRKLRIAALNEPCCCKLHGAISDELGINPKTTLSVKDHHVKVLCNIPINQTIMTKGLRKLISAQCSDDDAHEEVEITIPLTSLCRQHSNAVQGQSCCRFGNECMFVHLCRQLECTSSLDNKDKGLLSERTQSMQQTAESVLSASKCELAQPSQYSIRSTPLTLLPNLLQPDHSELPIIEVCPIQNEVKIPDGQFDFSNMSFALGSTHASNSSSCNFSCFAKSIEFTKHGCVWRHNPYAQCSLTIIEP